MRIGFKIGGAIMFYIISSASFAFMAFNINPNINWGMIALISFLIFGVYIGVWVYSLEKQVSHLKDTKPFISVEPFGFDLRVRNLGASAKFTAHITIQGKDNTWKFPLSGYWQKAKSYEAEIIKGDYDSILIGQVIKDKFNLQYYDFNSESLMVFPNKRTPELFTECEIDIQISSKPEMLKTTLYTYRIDINGLHYVSTHISSEKLRREDFQY